MCRAVIVLAIVALVSVVCALGPAVAPAAAKSLRLHSLEAGRNLVSDGKRHVAFETPDGTTRLLDTATNETASVLPPDGCRGGLTAIGSGRVLWSCGTESSLRAVVLDVRSGEQRRLEAPPADEARGLVQRGTLFGIGDQWIAGRGAPDPEARSPGSSFYWRWTTGDVRVQRTGVSSEFGQLDDPNRYADLDRTSLQRTLCRGLRPFTNSKGVLLAVGDGAGFRVDRSGRSSAYRLDSCSRASRVVSRCRGAEGDFGCGDPHLGSRLFTWTLLGRIRAVSKTGSTRYATSRLIREPQVVVNAGSTVVAQIPGRAGTEPKIYRTRVPRRSR